MHEDKRNFVTETFELPGMPNEENVSVDVHDNLLTVTPIESKKFESNRHKNGYSLRKRLFGRFSRSVPVPEEVEVCCFRPIRTGHFT